MKKRREEGGERGFAMLMVFVLAAVIAVSLYYDLPRAMFEHQRQKEQLLIDHGEQYSIAIRRFYLKFGRWPTTMDELKSTNNMRFLRREFFDPMTGKADWRIIHESAGGVLTDSLVHPANPLGQGQNGANGNTGTNGSTGGFGSTGSNSIGNTGGQSFGTLTSSQPFGTPMTQSGSSDSNADQPPPPLAPGMAFRPSDRGPQGGAHGGVSTGDGTGAGADTTYGAASVPGYADMGPSNQTPPVDTSNQNSTPSNLGMATNQPGVGTGSPGTGAAGGANPGAVVQQIQNGLLNPRQGPNSSPFGQNPGISGGGVGIAGVASKSPYQGIKSYKDHTRYKEWEFVFDASSMQQLNAPPQGQQVQPGQPGNTLGGGNTFGGGNNLGGGSNFGGGNTFGGGTTGNGSNQNGGGGGGPSQNPTGP